VLARESNSRPYRTKGVAPLYFVTPRRLSKFSLERMLDGMTPDASQSVAEAKDAFLEYFKALPPQVRDSVSKTQARYRRDYEKKVRPRRVSVAGAGGDWVYLRNHTRKHKLDRKLTGPYEELETDGRTYLINQDGLTYWVSGDHVVPAGPVDPANRPKRPQVAFPDALQPSGSEFVFERTWTIPGTRRGSYGCWSAGLGMNLTTIPGNTRGVCRLPRSTDNVAASGFSRRSRIRWSRVGTPRRRDRTAKRQKRSFIHVLRVMVHPSLRGRSYPGQRKARSRHMRQLAQTTETSLQSRRRRVADGSS